MRRGVRTDEAASGSGLGLAIVRDIAEIYRGSISLEASPMGGARDSAYRARTSCNLRACDYSSWFNLIPSGPT